MYTNSFHPSFQNNDIFKCIQTTTNNIQTKKPPSINPPSHPCIKKQNIMPPNKKININTKHTYNYPRSNSHSKLTFKKDISPSHTQTNKQNKTLHKIASVKKGLMPVTRPKTPDYESRRGYIQRTPERNGMKMNLQLNIGYRKTTPIKQRHNSMVNINVPKGKGNKAQTTRVMMTQVGRVTPVKKNCHISKVSGNDKRVVATTPRPVKTVSGLNVHHHNTQHVTTLKKGNCNNNGCNVTNTHSNNNNNHYRSSTNTTAFTTNGNYSNSNINNGGVGECYSPEIFQSFGKGMQTQNYNNYTHTNYNINNNNINNYINKTTNYNKYNISNGMNNKKNNAIGNNTNTCSKLPQQQQQLRPQKQFYPHSLQSQHQQQPSNYELPDENKLDFNELDQFSPPYLNQQMNLTYKEQKPQSQPQFYNYTNIELMKNPPFNQQNTLNTLTAHPITGNRQIIDNFLSQMETTTKKYSTIDYKNYPFANH